MKIVCPHCGHLIESENIPDNKQRGDLSGDILNNPPKGAWKYEDYDGMIIGASTRSPIAFFLVPFMTVWSGGSLGGIYITQMTSGEFNLMLSLFGIPFLIGSIVLLCINLMAIAGKVEVAIGMDSYVFTGVGKIGIKKRFDWDSVNNIYEQENIRSTGSRNNKITSSIIMEGSTRIKIGTGLKEEHRYFLLTALKHLKKR